MQNNMYAFYLTFLLCLSMQIIRVSSGFSCWLVCMGLCNANPAGMLANLASAGIYAVGCGAACTAGCAAGIGFLPFCISENSTVIVKDSQGAYLEKQIIEVKRNDIVLTLENNIPQFTTVVFNKKTEGNFDFLKFKCLEKSSGQIKEISVTPDHAMVIKEDEGNKIIRAKNVLISKNFLTEKGICEVIQIEKTFQSSKYTIVTAEGTILVSSILSSTICDSDIKENSPAEEVLSNWRKSHNFICLDSDHK